MKLSDSDLGERLPDVPDLNEDRIEEFLWWMCERQQIYIRRFVEGESPPWTESEVMQEYHFCNVRRELDHGTNYALKYLLLEDEADQDVLFNILLYRFFNRPETCDMWGGFVEADEFYPESVVDVLDVYAKNHTLFSSAYRVTTHAWADAETKHENIILGVIRDDILENLDEYTERVFGADSMEEAFEVLCEIRGVGDFLAYEVVTDLSYRHLPFSENDFVNVGPGAAGGLDILFGRSSERLIHWLQQNQEDFFDFFDMEFPYLEENPVDKGQLTLRDFEHSLCEYRKFVGVKHRNEGRRRFTPRDHAQDRLGEF